MSETKKQRIADPASKPHIGIIGAGLAGLRCADILLQHGFRVTVLEGRNRIGGRMHQQKLPTGQVVDLGPNWIHGTDNNPMLDLAKETKTAIGSWDTMAYVFNEGGELLSLAEGEAYSTIMWDIVQDAFSHSNKNTATISPDESLFDFFQTEVVKRIPDNASDFEEKRKVVLQMAELWGAFVGSPIYIQSLKFFWLEECIEGENLFCAGTYQKILERIAQPAIAQAEIIYQRRISKIHSVDEADGKVKVLSEDGGSLTFDEVILTAPLGWLKKNLAAFEPALPSRMTRAIESVGYGCLEKIYISFPKAFWRAPDDEGRSINGFCQWLAPKYALDSNPARWNQEIVEMASLPGLTSYPTLLFYVYGDESKHLSAECAKLSSKEKDTFLYDFFKPYYSRLPRYDVSHADCQPVACFATDWLSDDLAGNGSYSNFQVGLEDGDKDIETMREGLPERGLWLAGEHTAPFMGLGTATGAYWSGESVGRRIANAYGRTERDVLIETGQSI